MKWNKTYLRRRWLSIFIHARKITIPMMGGVPLYDFIVFFLRGIIGGRLSVRASAIAFNLFVAMFPTIIFLFTLLPYIPIEGFREQMMSFMYQAMPHNAYYAIEGTINDVLTQQHGGLLSFGFIAALIFSTSGIDAMISAFNTSLHTVESRTLLNQRLVALFLVGLLTLFVTIAIACIVVGKYVYSWLITKGILEDNIFSFLLNMLRWIVGFGFLYCAYSCLYMFAPAKRAKWSSVSIGGAIAAVLTIFISTGFTYYIDNFGRYNKLYGSIGAMLVVLMWLYLNSYSLIIGFEFNTSLKEAGSRLNRQSKRKKISLLSIFE
ncbi:YihY/virulence factor BrkB family protein [Halosquirtibacter xylanolyticus]|uniref:YihY/virulence factor BrkB family protein n=1 Tax=Halosquirtibacter xylanolyticus TaxID=3374599 RepID=UPI003749BABF|nr:YihY/virulence factor BrkB family protein [Prolixibacteraceae bacterium]